MLIYLKGISLIKDVFWKNKHVFRFAKYYKTPEGEEVRTLIKAYGIRFEIIVIGTVRPPHFFDLNLIFFICVILDNIPFSFFDHVGRKIWNCTDHSELGCLNCFPEFGEQTCVLEIWKKRKKRKKSNDTPNLIVFPPSDSSYYWLVYVDVHEETSSLPEAQSGVPVRGRWIGGWIIIITYYPSQCWWYWIKDTVLLFFLFFMGGYKHYFPGHLLLSVFTHRCQWERLMEPSSMVTWYGDIWLQQTEPETEPTLK